MRKLPLRFWYLGIVDKKDVKRGVWEPTWILCKSEGTAESRSGYRVTRIGGGREGLPRVLVTSLTGNDLLINYLTCYRTRDRMEGTASKRKTRKYYPEGFLCYFACNLEGQRTGPAYLIKKVPDKAFYGTDKGFEEMKKALSAEPRLAQVLIKDDKYVDFPSSGVKRKFPQIGDAPIKMREDKRVLSKSLLKKLSELAREQMKKLNVKRRDLRLRKYRTRKE